MPNALEQRGDDVLLRVRVQPRAARVAVSMDQGAIRVRVTAPPADGQANRMVCAAVADWLDVPKTSVRIHGGDKSRDKVLRIEALNFDAASEKLAVLQRGMEC